MSSKLILAADGVEDDIVLHKKFAKLVGPHGKLEQNDDSCGLKAIADDIIRLRKQDNLAVATVQHAAESLSENIENNDRERKRKAAHKALAKRAPQRKARAVGAVVLRPAAGPANGADPAADTDDI